MGEIRYIELFAGIGGFRYGIENLGCVQQGLEKGKKHSEDNKDKRGLFNSRKFTCVYANEWDKYASSIYKKHFGECDTRDVTKVPSTDIPDHDLLVGGFPCQAFSIAGKRRGFDDTRGTLFFEIARILRDKRPRYFLLENVKGLLSHDEGKTFQTILGVLSDLGYEYQWQVLNSKNFGVPQNRERVFIVGHLRGTPQPKVFPITGSDKWDIEKGKISPTLRGFGHGWQGQHNDTNVVIKDMKIRRLTPVECERLQGFPDNWTEGISDTQRYKCLGNAVTTNVVSFIAGRLFQFAREATASAGTEVFSHSPRFSGGATDSLR